MRRSIHWFPLILGLLLAGCGGCQGGSETSRPAPQQQAPAPMAARPTPTGQKPAAPAPAAQAPAAPTQQEVDCFVLVDAEPDFGAPPMKVQFDTEIECTGAPVTYSWDFGDGTKGGNDARPMHTYDKPGEYVAVVKVTAPDGGEGEDEIDITVDADLDE